MKKSRLYLSSTISELLCWRFCLSGLLKTTIAFPIVIELGLVLIAALLFKRSRRLDNIEHGKPAEFLYIRVQKGKKLLPGILIALIFF